jgi:hypothetical protein
VLARHGRLRGDLRPARRLRRIRLLQQGRRVPPQPLLQRERVHRRRVPNRKRLGDQVRRRAAVPFGKRAAGVRAVQLWRRAAVGRLVGTALVGTALVDVVYDSRGRVVATNFWEWHELGAKAQGSAKVWTASRRAAVDAHLARAPYAAGAFRITICAAQFWDEATSALDVVNLKVPGSQLAQTPWATAPLIYLTNIMVWCALPLAAKAPARGYCARVRHEGICLYSDKSA